MQAVQSPQTVQENLEYTSTQQKKSYLIAKRIFDVLSAGAALLVLLPVFIVLSLLIALDSEGPVIFKHKRVGKNGKPIALYKFRSMVNDAEEAIKRFTPEQKAEWEKSFKLENDPRITKIGAFLRKTSLDELPQLLNIIKGDLSVVGPRPVVDEEVERYGENKEKFLSVTPGLTGYWQAYARSDCSYEQRIEMELYYVDHASFWWDIKIIFATVGAVLSRKGAR